MVGTARRWFAVAVAVVGAVTLVAGQSLVAHGAVTPASTPTWGTFVQVATKDLADASARQAVSQAYSTVILRGAITSALANDLHQRRAGIVLLAYDKAAGLSDAEVQAVSANHPEWIARTAKGAVIHPRNIKDTTLADLTNADFRAWQASQIADEVRSGTDGAFIDTLGAYFPPDFYTGRPAANGNAVTDAAWRDGSVDLINRVKALTGKQVIANGFGLGSGQAYYAAPADADKLIAAADGVQIEGFTRWGGAPVAQARKAPAWNEDLAFLELLGARNKTALAYTKVDPSATPAQLNALRDYALGSFLVAFAPGRASFGFDDGKRIPATASTADWATGLSSPTGLRSRINGGWQRAFGSKTLTQVFANAPAVS